MINKNDEKVKADIQNLNNQCEVEDKKIQRCQAFQESNQKKIKVKKITRMRWFIEMQALWTIYFFQCKLKQVHMLYNIFDGKLK